MEHDTEESLITLQLLCGVLVYYILDVQYTMDMSRHWMAVLIAFDDQLHSRETINQGMGHTTSPGDQKSSAASIAMHFTHYDTSSKQTRWSENYQCACKNSETDTSSHCLATLYKPILILYSLKTDDSLHSDISSFENSQRLDGS